MARKTDRCKRRSRLVRRLLIRRGFSHCGALLVYCLNFLLACAVVALAYTLLSHEIRVPGILISRIEAELEERGLEITVDTAHFDLMGRIYVTEMKLQPDRFGEQIFHASRALVSLDRLKLLALQPDLSELEVEDVRLMCPSSLSPSGVPETVARIATARIRHEGGLWILDSVIGEIDELVVAAHGSFAAAPPKEEDETPTLDAILGKFSELAPQAVEYEQHLATVTNPVLHLSFSGNSHAGLIVEADLIADNVRHPEYGEASDIRLHAKAGIGERRTEPLTAAITVANFTHREYGRLRDLNLLATWAGLPTRENPWPQRIDLNTGSVAHDKATVATVVAKAFPKDYPEIEATAFATFEGETVTAGVHGNVETRTGELTLTTRLGRDWLPAVSRALGRDVTYYATVGIPPDIKAKAFINSGGKLQRVEFRVLSGPILARGVHLDRARVHGEATLKNLRIDRLEIQRGDEWAQGHYQDHLGTRDTRFLLHGALRPMSIAPWFGEWWGRFWDDFEFLGKPPEFDVDIVNNWLARDAYKITGHTDAEMLSLRGVKVNWLRSGFRIQHNFYDLFDAAIGRVEGRIDGNVQLLYRTGQKDPLRQTWQFKSTADIGEMAAIFGEGGKAMFEPYSYAIPPAVVARGNIVNDSGVFDTSIELTLVSENEFRYYDFPVDAIATDVIIGNDRVELPNLRAEYAEGIIRAEAVVDKGILTVDAGLSDADYDTAVFKFNRFLDTRSPPPEDQAEPAGFSARKINGRLNIEVSAVGPLTEFSGYTGKGVVSIRQGDLARFRLFGPVGDILSPLGIRFGRLQLTDADSNFLINKNLVTFPDLKFTGKTEAIEAAGDYRISDGAVAFKARLFPLRESDGALTQIFGTLLDPFSHLLEMQLSGTLRNPKWALTRNPFTTPSSGLQPEETPAGSESTAATAETATSDDSQAGGPADDSVSTTDQNSEESATGRLPETRGAESLSEIPEPPPQAEGTNPSGF